MVWRYDLMVLRGCLERGPQVKTKEPEEEKAEAKLIQVRDHLAWERFR